MEKTLRIRTRIFALLLTLMLMFTSAFCLVSCGDKTPAPELWENAVYKNDKTFGNGSKTVKVEVKAGEKAITFTLKTDKETLGDALLEHNLIAGDESEYGLYLKTVNGITADYDVDKSYWAFYKNGEYMMTGVDGTTIADGEHYELVYTK